MKIQRSRKKSTQDLDSFGQNHLHIAHHEEGNGDDGKLGQDVDGPDRVHDGALEDHVSETGYSSGSGD